MLLVLVVVAGGINAMAQKYITAAGIRLDKRGMGITVQQRMGINKTFEAMLTGNKNEFEGTLLLERHIPIIFRGFNTYFGAGAHLGNVQNSQYYYGLDAIAGIELKTPLLPLLFSIDIKPQLDFNDPLPDLGNSLNKLTWETGLSARLILFRDKHKKK